MEDTTTNEPKQESKFFDGVKYGCGGTMGVIICLTLIPLVLCGGCLIIVGAPWAVKEIHEKATRFEPVMTTVSLAKQHAEGVIQAGTGYEELNDISMPQALHKGETKDLHGERVKILGKGKKGCRRVETMPGVKWWMPGNTQILIDKEET